MTQTNRWESETHTHKKTPIDMWGKLLSVINGFSPRRSLCEKRGQIHIYETVETFESLGRIALWIHLIDLDYIAEAMGWERWFASSRWSSHLPLDFRGVSRVRSAFKFDLRWVDELSRLITTTRNTPIYPVCLKKKSIWKKIGLGENGFALDCLESLSSILDLNLKLLG